MAVTPNSPNLAWWRLARVVPGPVFPFLMTLVVAPLGAVTAVACSVIYGGDSGDILQSALMGAFGGLFLGGIAGLHTARAAHATGQPPSRWARVRAVRAAAGDLYITASVLAFATTLYYLALYLDDAATGTEKAWEAFGQWTRPTLDGVLEGMTFLTLAFVVLLLPNSLGAGRLGIPQRGVPRLRKLPVELLLSTGLGVLVGVPWTLVATAQLWGLIPGSIDFSEGLTATLLIAAVTGVVVGVGRWSGSPTPLDRYSPETVFRADRSALLLATVTGAFTVGVISSAVAVAAEAPARTSAAWGVGLTFATALLYFFGSGSAWLSFTIARSWLAFRRRVPWRLVSFLRTARQDEVLRQEGPYLQIRHAAVREHLIPAEGPRAPIGVARHYREKGSQRRWLSLMVASVVLAVGPAFIFSLVDVYQPKETVAVLSPDLTRVAAINEKGDLRLLDAATGKPLRTLAADMGRDKLAWSAAGLAAGGGDGRVRVWDPVTFELRSTLDHGGSFVSAVAWATGNLLVTGHIDGMARLWDSGGGRPVRTFDQGSEVTAVAWSPERVLATGGKDGLARTWNPDNGTLLQTLAPGMTVADGTPLLTMAFSPDGDVLATGDVMGGVAQWRVADGQAMHPATKGPYSRTQLIVWSPNGAAFAAAFRWEAVRLWNRDAERPDRAIEVVDRSGCQDRWCAPVLALAWAPDGRSVVTVGTDGVAHRHDDPGTARPR